MNALLHVLAPYHGVAAFLVGYFIDSLWMGIAGVVLTAIVLHLWKPLDAAARYAVWYVALIVIAVGPLATIVAQRWHDPLLVTISVEQPHVPARYDVLFTGPAPWAHAPMGLALPEAVGFAVIAVWLVVGAIGVVRILAGAVVLARLKRDALPLAPERRAGFPLWRARAEAAGTVRSRLCVSDRVDVPLAVGLFDGMVVVPQHVLDAFEPGDIDRFVLHELAHLDRRDDWTALVQRLVQTVQFFNPAVHFIARRLDLEREIACDDRVVAATQDVRSYAVGLTRMAESTAWPHRGLATPAIFVTRKQLSLRVEQLLASRRLAAPRIVLAPAVVALVASACVVAAASPFSPSFALVGTQTPAAPPADQPKILVVEQERSTLTHGRKHSIFYIRRELEKTETRTLMPDLTPEQFRALVTSIEAKKH
jgi:beta-lactamase regulating signal transducer with metallopeptidase domain